MTRMFFALWSARWGLDLRNFQEARKRGADVGVVVTPSHDRSVVDAVACSGLPVMVDNGAYQAWTKGEEPQWEKAKQIAEELEAEYVVALDEIGDAEKSLELSLETFKSTHIEKIVPFHAVAEGRENFATIKRHLRLLIDNNVRVIGIPCPAANSKGNLRFAINCRWIIPTRCHALGFPYGKPKFVRTAKYFDSIDAKASFIKGAKRTIGSQQDLVDSICRYYQNHYARR